MQSLKIQSSQGISKTVRTDEPQNANIKSVGDDSDPAQELQEAQQDMAIAKSKLGELAISATKGQLESMYNPKEIQVDKSKSKADDRSKENRAILYNGHAGLGENG
jgi:hypothetical protein